jgi:hypothetical protein
LHCFKVLIWCGQEDLNLHTTKYQILNLARLPFRHVRINAEQNLL